ncbi:hypothetical protein DFH94DRAFT_765418 [Russula ochroleuca]|uniref:Uncharacterized protein n=1 Tax=Russula ochroleuca TaxID=152965 RepID=A0A9P5K0N0_9AGAM|nr:hypothetical protein DFH94DRAFT_765418 [Russula ochroleuca]
MYVSYYISLALCSTIFFHGHRACRTFPSTTPLPLIYYKTLRAHYSVSISMSMSHLIPSTPLTLISSAMYYPHFLFSCNMTRDSKNRWHMSSRTWNQVNQGTANAIIGLVWLIVRLVRGWDRYR